MQDAERYDDPEEKIAFYYRAARQKGRPDYEPRLAGALRSAFPQGLERLDLTQLKAAPTDGVFVNGQTNDMMRQGVRAGDIVVGLDGWRVHNAVPYTTVRGFDDPDQPAMTLVLWRGRYLEVPVRFRERRMGVDIVDYPQRGWVPQ